MTDERIRRYAEAHPEMFEPMPKPVPPKPVLPVAPAAARPEKTIEGVVLDGFDRLKRYFDDREAAAMAKIADLTARIENLEEHVIKNSRSP